MKEKIRDQSIKNRDALTLEDRNRKSDKIRDFLLSMPEFKQAHTILFYSSIKSEVRTDKLIRRALDLGKRAVLPLTNKRSGQLELYEVRDFKELSHGMFGILEPKKNHPVKKAELELVLVPGMVFDLCGHRIGYGRGYYDKLLLGMGPVPKVGLSFEVQMVAEIPAEPHDIKVDKIVTEKKVIDCRE